MSKLESNLIYIKNDKDKSNSNFIYERALSYGFDTLTNEELLISLSSERCTEDLKKIAKDEKT